MLRIIAKTNQFKESLTRAEAVFLYEALNSFGYPKLLNTAKSMYKKESSPFYKRSNWVSFEEFHKFLSYFCDLSSEVTQKSFVTLLSETDKEEEGSRYFTLPEISSLTGLRAEARAMIQFLEAMADYQNYEVMLNSLGYNLSGDDYISEGSSKKRKKKVNE